MIDKNDINGQWSGMRAALLIMLAGGGGCADHVQSTIVACPCNQGVCCSSGVCAPDQSSCDQATSALSNQAAGTWSGYTENFAFPSGSDALNLTFRVQSDGSFTGQVILGSGTPPPPATDGSVGWPSSDIDHPYLFEGLAYSARNVQWTARRLQFDIDLNEPWGPWCRLHQPFENDDGSSTCRPYPLGGTEVLGSHCFVDPPQGGPIPIDCGVLFTCPCTCSAAGCDLADSPGPSGGPSFDVAIRSEDADGSIQLQGVTHNVRLIRASN